MRINSKLLKSMGAKTKNYSKYGEPITLRRHGPDRTENARRKLEKKRERSAS